MLTSNRIAIGLQASKDQLVFYEPRTSANGFQSARLGLVFQATPNLFSRGVLKLQCKGTLTLTYEFEAYEAFLSGVLKNKTQIGPYSTGKSGSLLTLLLALKLS